MKRVIGFGTYCLMLFMACFAGWVHAADLTPEMVVSHVDAAVSEVQAKGDAAFDALTDPDGKWVDGELYVFIYSSDGTIVAHLNKKLVGKNLIDIKDVNGKAFAAEFVQIAKSDKGEGWSEYWWPKPGEKKASQKVSFIKRVPGTDYLIGVGTYSFTLEQARQATGR